MDNPAFRKTLSEIEQFSATSKNLLALQQFVVDLIAERLPYYNWFGF